MRGGGYLNLGLAVRAASSTDFQRMEGRGFVFAPELQFRLPGFPKEDWTLFLGASTMFADRRYHQYYYEVNPEFATASRPGYAARAGYFSTDASAGISIPVIRKRLQAAFFTSLTSYDAAANESSPLMRAKMGWSNAAVLIWTIGKSERLAAALEDEDLVR
jgi:outer membrane scaffolding protein for murein synthesis (MipA/OmpV family)